MAKCSSDLDCLQDIDDRLSRVGQAVTEFVIAHRFQSDLSSVNYLLIPILIIVLLILCVLIYSRIRSRIGQNPQLELRPLINQC